MQQLDYAIIGAGISGLSAAYYLKKLGKKIVLLEKSGKVGGALSSEQTEGFLLERGANTVAMNQELADMLEDLNLSAGVEFPQEQSHKRFIYRNDQLHALAQHPLSLFRSSLLSSKAKLRLLKEPFIRSRSSEKESVAEFFSRRIGTEAYEYLVAAGLQGVYAGIPEKMSMGAILPAIVKMEKEKGSLLKGLIAQQKAAKKSKAPKRRIFALKQGMGHLCESLGNVVREELRLNTTITEIRKTAEGFKVETDSNLFQAKELIYAAPAHGAKMLATLAPDLAKNLLSVSYAPMILLHLAYETEDIGQSCDGFGFLIPPKENKSLLGAIWNSALFPDRAKKGNFLFTVFVGGASHPELSPQNSAALIEGAQKEFEAIMKIDGKAVFRDMSFWQEAIPQYGLDHLTLLEKIETELKKHPGLHLLGNYLQGVSVGDCVKRAKDLVV